MVTFISGCRQEAPSAGGSSAKQESTSEKSAELRFPPDLHSKDAEVNDFLREAMQACAGRDYGRFRLLWSTTENPLTREAFEESWRAVRVIEVAALEPAYIEAGMAKPSETVETAAAENPSDLQLVHVVFAKVELDPKHRAASQSAEREVVMMIVQEQGRWRLAHAPKPIREWIKLKVKPVEMKSNPPAKQATSNPTGG